MDIEAIVKKHLYAWKTSLVVNPRACAIAALEEISEALTELSAAHAIELRAYEATVQNMEERVKQLEAERVPVSVLESMVNLVEGLPAYDWRSNKTGMRLKDASAWVKFYCAAKGAMLAAAPAKEGE